MNRYDPELLHRRRVITFSVLTVAVILLITGFLYGIGVSFIEVVQKRNKQLLKAMSRW